MNIVVLKGRLARPAEERALPSGSRIASLELTIPREGERAETVPVACFEPSTSVSSLDTGDEIVVVGRVRRRFFRAGGGTGSRTEVVADAVVPARSIKRAAAAIDRALAAARG